MRTKPVSVLMILGMFVGGGYLYFFLSFFVACSFLVSKKFLRKEVMKGEIEGLASSLMELLSEYARIVL